MRAALIAVGSELLRAERHDSNSVWLTQRLEAIGIPVVGRSVVGDDVVALVDQIRRLRTVADLLVMTGGLGPTEDDRTRTAVAEALGRPLARDPEQVATLRKWFEGRGRPFTQRQQLQADLPCGAEWIENTLGTAAGLWIEESSSVLVALPGVPAEMKRMFRKRVEPVVAARSKGGLARRTLRVGGRTESEVDDRVRDLYRMPGAEVTILIGREGVELHLRTDGANAAEASERLEQLDRAMAERLGADLYGRDDEGLAGIVGESLRAGGRTLATAESCTAGLLAASVTSVPGSSGWFRGGLVVYSDDLKQKLAGVPQALLAQHGAVSEPVARALASGARVRCAADVGVGITGVAGPDGGTDDKPVGLVHVAIDLDGQVDAWRLRIAGDREQVRRRTVTATLDRLRRLLTVGSREA